MSGVKSKSIITIFFIQKTNERSRPKVTPQMGHFLQVVPMEISRFLSVDYFYSVSIFSPEQLCSHKKQCKKIVKGKKESSEV